MHFCSWLHCQGVTTGTCTSNTSHPMVPLGLYDNCQSSLLRLTNGKRKPSSLLSLYTRRCFPKHVIGTQRTAIDNCVIVFVLFLCYSKQIYLVSDFYWGDKMTHHISGLYKSTNFILVFLLRFLFYKINIKKEERILLLLWQINNFLPQFNFELSRAFQK